MIYTLLVILAFAWLVGMSWYVERNTQQMSGLQYLAIMASVVLVIGMTTTALVLHWNHVNESYSQRCHAAGGVVSHQLCLRPHSQIEVP